MGLATRRALPENAVHVNDTFVHLPPRALRHPSLLFSSSSRLVSSLLYLSGSSRAPVRGSRPPPPVPLLLLLLFVLFKKKRRYFLKRILFETDPFCNRFFFGGTLLDLPRRKRQDL